MDFCCLSAYFADELVVAVFLVFARSFLTCYEFSLRSFVYEIVFL